jgi:hypothetical protein
MNSDTIKGDMRMYKAVQAKLRNSELSPYDALKLGGYVFIPPPQTNSPKQVTDATLRDTDGISLSQRKHQFRRRLRLTVRKTEPMSLTTKLIDEKKRKFEGNLDEDNFTGRRVEIPIDHGYHLNIPLDSADSNYQKASVSLNSQGSDRLPQIVNHLTNHYRSKTDARNDSRQISANRTDSQSYFRTNYDNGVDDYNVSDRKNILRETIAQPRTRCDLISYSSMSELKPSSSLSIAPGLEQRMTDACRHYLNESPSLLKQSMILAGFEVQETDNASEAFIRIFESIVMHETKLLMQLLSNAQSSKTGTPNIDFASSRIRANINNQLHNGKYLYNHRNDSWSYGHSGLYDVRILSFTQILWSCISDCNCFFNFQNHTEDKILSFDQTSRDGDSEKEKLFRSESFDSLTFL